MQTPVNYDICIYKEAVFEESFNFTDDNDAPLDMTGWQAYAQLRETKNRQSPLLTNFTIDQTNFSNGCVRISLSSSVTAALPTRIIGYYDLMIIDTTGKPRYYVEGTAWIHSTVTSLITDPEEYYTERDSIYVSALLLSDEKNMVLSSYTSINVERTVQMVSV